MVTDADARLAADVRDSARALARAMTAAGDAGLTVKMSFEPAYSGPIYDGDNKYVGDKVTKFVPHVSVSRTVEIPTW